MPLAQTEFAIFKDSNDAIHKASEQCYRVKEREGFRWKQKKCGDALGAICEQRILGISNNAHQNSSCFIFMYIFNSKDKAQWYASCHCNKYGHLWTLSMYRLVNLSRAPWDLVPGEARGHIEWRVKVLPTYLVHGSHKIFVFCVSIYFLKFFYNPKYFINSILMTDNFFWAKSRIFCNCDKNFFSFWLFKEWEYLKREYLKKENLFQIRALFGMKHNMYEFSSNNYNLHNLLYKISWHLRIL